MDNPYQSPSPSPIGGTNFGVPPVAPVFVRSGLVGQVRVVSILMIVEGVLELLFGSFYLVMGIVMPTFLNVAMKNDPNFRKGAGADPEMMMWVMGAVYLGGGALAAIGGGVRIFAGIRNYQFRNRVLGIVSCILGLGSIMTCYCTPTSVGLAIYGLIVLFNGPVTAAFQLREQGYSPDQILAMTYHPFANSPPAENK